jgi:K+-sensing histidine kinase KdpD
MDAGGVPGRWLSLLPGMERQILLLRWLALLSVLILHLFDRSSAGVLLSVPWMALIVAGCNGLLLLLMRYVRWLRRPLNYMAVDTVVATLAVYLTGGYHSSFFVLYVFIAIGAAFYLELVPTVIVTLCMGLIYVAACYVNPASLESPYAPYILAANLLLLLVVAVLCALLLEQLRREHRETEHERTLALRLRALNELFHQLSTTLDLDRTLQTVVEAAETLLGADLTGIALLDEDGRHLSVVAPADVDVPLLAEQRWSIDDDAVSAFLSSGQPYVVDEPARYLDALPVTSAGQRAFASVASIVVVPLLSDEQPLGVLGVVFGRQRTFTEEDRVFLLALGQEAALAIRNAHLYEREREQVARLRALDELQEGFVSAVSHELRTPLTCIKTSVDLLHTTSGGLSAEQVDLIRTIRHHLNRLEAFVSELIEITRLEAGRVTLSKQPTDLRLLIGRVVESLRPLTDRKSQTVRLSCPEAVSRAEVDRRRIEQVLTNVLSNAIKFTPKQGQIGVSLSEAPDSLQVCVADNGPGIPEQDRERIFEKFYVVSDRRGLAGLGLGLYIARELIGLHGGRIWAESQEGEGSTFHIVVPKRA